METSLHRQLKRHYAPTEAECEVTLGGYRIDAIADGRLIEIQQSALFAIRQKISVLVKKHDVLLVKPLVGNKTLLLRPAGSIDGPLEEMRRRLSPKHETVWNLFDELVHFRGVFPHPRLTIHVLLTDQTEIRRPRPPRRRRQKDYIVEDRSLDAVTAEFEISTVADILRLIPPGLPAEFTTADLAKLLGESRSLAQKILYVLRFSDGATDLGRRGRTPFYRLNSPVRRRRRAA